MENGRQIWQWRRVHAVTRPGDELCSECMERFVWGTYIREVYVVTHPRYGQRIEVRRLHDDPVCPQYLEE